VELELLGDIMVDLLYSVASTLERLQAFSHVDQIEKEFRRRLKTPFLSFSIHSENLRLKALCYN
jgi:hypothetical protein